MDNYDSFVTRRRLLKAGGALAGASTLGVLSPVWAQSGGRIVVGTWGGDYSKLLAKNIDTPLLVPKKYEVVHDIGGDSERRAKMRAEARPAARHERSAGTLSAQMFEMHGRGPLPADRLRKDPELEVPAAADEVPVWRRAHLLGKVILYNPKLIATPPTSFADALDPKHGNKLGIIDIQYPYTMMAAGLASGGSMTNYEPGKERLLACRKAGAKILPTNEAMAQALQNEEVGICIMWKARAVQWQKAGAKVDTVAPKEGIPLYISGFVIPKNAQNKDAAHFWLNEMLEPSAQEAFAEDMGYNGSVTNAKIPAETEKRIGFTADERKRLIDLDYGYLAKNDSAFKEWWDKSFKG
jgi:putative spermidine/putrescine transport system substrate-binding protein